jgi:hypothetical protein
LENYLNNFGGPEDHLTAHPARVAAEEAKMLLPREHLISHQEIGGRTQDPCYYRNGHRQLRHAVPDQDYMRRTSQDPLRQSLLHAATDVGSELKSESTEV